MRQSLTESIEALKDCDFDDFFSGYEIDIYLNPESEKIYVFHDYSGNSCPENAHSGIDQLLLSVKSNSDSESIYHSVKSVEERLNSLLDLYQGTEFQNPRFVGKWKESSFELLSEIQSKIQSHSVQIWSPDEMFEPVLDRVKQYWEDGNTAENIVEIMGCETEDGSAICKEEAAIEWLKGIIEEWESERN